MGEEMNRPLVFSEGAYSQKDLDSFIGQNQGAQKSDIYEQQLEELFEITYPGLDSSAGQYRQFMGDKTQPGKGSWIFLPWSNKLLHILNEADFFALRTNRNQYLVKKEEQQKLQDYTVGILGLSVGGSMAMALAYSAACGRLVLADRDNFSTSNLNRVRVGVADIGQPKLIVTMQQIYESNPYAKLKGFPNGVTKDNIAGFIEGGKFILFDEIDDFEMKVRVRLEAQKRHAPVVMLTNLGDNVLIDIERYDTEPKTQPFNGLINEVIDDILSGEQITEDDKKRFAAQIVSIKHVPTRALESLRDIGSTLVGRPQLYSTVAISGGLAPYIVRRIALGYPLPSGRYFFSLADIFKQPRDDLEMNPERQDTLKALKPKK